MVAVSFGRSVFYSISGLLCVRSNFSAKTAATNLTRCFLTAGNGIWWLGNSSICIIWWEKKPAFFYDKHLFEFDRRECGEKAHLFVFGRFLFDIGSAFLLESSFWFPDAIGQWKIIWIGMGKTVGQKHRCFRCGKIYLTILENEFLSNIMQSNWDKICLVCLRKRVQIFLPLKLEPFKIPKHAFFGLSLTFFNALSLKKARKISFE